jgi:BlaI family penicillinase repressor
MSGKLLEELGELQRAVIEMIWELGEATVHQVRRQLRSRGKRLAYTTVLTSMQNLEKAGWLHHRSEGKTYVYMPTRTRDEAGANSVRKFVERMFDGDALLMFQHLMRTSTLTDEELQELRKMVDEKRKEKKP